jgi:small subunit ribosomal protein S2
MITISPQDLLANACHYGQKKSRWNPKIKPYLFGQKQGVHIFDLNKSAEKLAELLNRIAELSKAGKTILFVSTKPHTQEIFKQLKEETGMPIVSYKWIGGLLTNFSTIKERILYMKRLQKEFETDEIKRYTKKEQSQFAKELEKLETALSGVADMGSKPHAVFVVDGFKDRIAIDEAKHLGIEVLGIADSNVDPDDYNYFVPANDDSMKSLEFILGHVVTAILSNQKAKKTPTPS